MSIYSFTKGTELESAVNSVAQAEANGVTTYYALSKLAEDQGLHDLSKTFIEIANQEAVHAGFYAVLNGRYPEDFWGFLEGMCKAEDSADSKLKGLADEVRKLGSDEAANEIEKFAAQEKNHGVILRGILDNRN